MEGENSLTPEQVWLLRMAKPQSRQELADRLFALTIALQSLNRELGLPERRMNRVQELAKHMQEVAETINDFVQ